MTVGTSTRCYARVPARRQPTWPSTTVAAGAAAAPMRLGWGDDFERRGRARIARVARRVCAHRPRMEHAARSAADDGRRARPGPQHRRRRRRRRLGRAVRRRRARRARARAPLGVRAPGVVRGRPRRSPTRIAANIDVVFLCPLVRRRAEPAPSRARARARASTAAPTRSSCSPRATSSTIPSRRRRELQEVALGVPVLVSSGRRGERARRAARHARVAGRTVALLGASGVGKSTLVNALARRAARRRPPRSARRPPRPPHDASPPSCSRVPDDGGWLIDTPGMRALSLWLSATASSGRSSTCSS